MAEDRTSYLLGTMVLHRFLNRNLEVRSFLYSLAWTLSSWKPDNLDYGQVKSFMNGIGISDKDFLLTWEEEKENLGSPLEKGETYRQIKGFVDWMDKQIRAAG